MALFTDEILEKIFSHPEAVKVPVGCQATMVSVIEEVLEEAQKNKATAYCIDSFNVTN